MGGCRELLPHCHSVKESISENKEMIFQILLLPLEMFAPFTIRLESNDAKTKTALNKTKSYPHLPSL